MLERVMRMMMVSVAERKANNYPLFEYVVKLVFTLTHTHLCVVLCPYLVGRCPITSYKIILYAPFHNKVYQQTKPDQRPR